MSDVSLLGTGLLGAPIARRLAAAARELAEFGEYDYAIINDDLDAAVDGLRSIVVARPSGPRRRASPRGARVTAQSTASQLRATDRAAWREAVLAAHVDAASVPDVSAAAPGS